MSQDDQVAAAKAEAAVARTRLMETIGELRARLSPKALAEDAADGARQQALKLGMTSLEATRQHPAVAGGLAGLIVGLIFWRARRGGKAQDFIEKDGR